MNSYGVMIKSALTIISTQNLFTLEKQKNCKNTLYVIEF